MNDFYEQLLGLSTPSTATGTTSNGTTSGATPSTTTSGSGSSFLNTLTSLANLGVNTYNSVTGNSSATKPATGSKTVKPATSVASGFTSFFTSTTGIVVTLAGVAVLFGLLIFIRRSK